MICNHRDKKSFLYFLPVVLAIALSACQQETPVFTKLMPEETGVDFMNMVSENDSVDVDSHPFLYNGGGVAVGDINNDGLPDLYITGNQVSSRLYLNLGGMKFQDITEQSGTGTERWVSGASMVDINYDEYMDIYLSVTGGPGTKDSSRANLLFINNGDNTFREAAEEFDLADTGYTVHAAFFDYDLDGDLDVYLLNNYEQDFLRENRIRPKDTNPESPKVDKLFRNNGGGTFTDVSLEAGITKEGYGLGIAVNDLNNDGWPDLYISNDILTNDQLYINNGDPDSSRDGQVPTFTDRVGEWLDHTSFSGMGADIGDFNNDGRPDIFQVDMLPQTQEEREKTLIDHGQSQYDKLRELGYTPQFMYNTLQLNRGKTPGGTMVFSEISREAGVHATGWSWAALLDDLNNDGLPDLLVTNGYPKNLISLQYFMDLNNIGPFGTPRTREAKKKELLEALEDIRIINKLFKNNGDLTFTDQSEEWGFHTPGYSYGAVTADLDRDGDLDLVINNLNDTVSIYRNNTISQSESTRRKANFLQVKLRGPGKNPDGVGAKLELVSGDIRQFRYISPYRGYISTSDVVAHFGLGGTAQVDSLVVTWPGGKQSTCTGIGVNGLTTVQFSDDLQCTRVDLRSSMKEALLDDIKVTSVYVTSDREDE